MNGKERKTKFIAVSIALGAMMSVWACKKEIALEQKGLIDQKANPQAVKAALASVPIRQEFAEFDHRQKDHRETSCRECHRRDPQSAVAKYPYHDACARCHTEEPYLMARDAGPFCAVCHQTGEAIDAQEKSRLKTFPSKLAAFGLKQFSHRLHLERSAGQDNGQRLRCESCHQFDAPKLVADFPSHPECYRCHAHSADQKLGECQNCHVDLSLAMKYQKGLTTPSKLYNFKHSTHLKQPSIGANCNRCHQIAGEQIELVRSDIVRINTPSGLKHRSACWECHVQAKEPTCTKCHVGGITLKDALKR